MKKSQGYTLIEVMIVVTILAILAAVAAPSFRSIKQKRQVSAAAIMVEDALNLARLSAMTRGKRVNVCALNDVLDTSSTATCMNWGDLNSLAVDVAGVVVYEENAADPALVIPTNVISREPFQGVAQYQINLIFAGANPISFNRRGRTTNGTLNFVHAYNNSMQKNLIVSVPGRVRQCIPANC